MRAPKRKLILIIFTGIFFIFLSSPLSIASIPLTGSETIIEPLSGDLSFLDTEPDNSAYLPVGYLYEKQSIKIKSFIQEVENGESEKIRGIFSENEFALPVVQQPSGQPGFVSLIKDVVTEFALPRKYGVTGIIAHNFLAGGNFFDLKLGDLIQVVYGDGVINTYVITSIQNYQAVTPQSPNSEFIDLETSEKLSATQLFKRVYMGNHHLTLQTCIEKDLEDSWGRLFIIAEHVI